MPLERLIRQIAEETQFYVSQITLGDELPPLGLRRSARLPVLTAMSRSLDRPTLLVASRPDRALALFDELQLWSPDLKRQLFPEPNALFYEKEPWGDAARRDRIAALTTLARYHIPGAPLPEISPLIVLSSRALMSRTLPRREFLKATRNLRPGMVIQPERLVRLAASSGYQPTSIVVASGQIARRGGILDIWPPSDEQPSRIEFFGDEVETLRSFDPSTQRTIAPREKLTLTPAREYLLSEHMPADTEEINEFHLPLLHPTPASILDYLPEQGLVFIEDLQALEETINEIEEQAVAFRRDSLMENNIPDDYPLPYLTWSEVSDALSRHSVVELGPSTLAEKSELAQRFQSGQRFGGQLKHFMDHLVESLRDKDDLVIVSRQYSRLTGLWDEISRYLEAGLADPHFIKGSLSEGWNFTTSQSKTLQLITDGEIFGWQRPEPRSRRRQVAESPEAEYADLQVGDYVVHVDHGIGLYMGLVNRKIAGIEREYLNIEYADEAQLFVPVHQADRVTRYIGPDSRLPSLSRLGGAEWQRVKIHVKEAVQKVAEDLLDLYAKRNVVEGHAFSSDTPWQQELEASFPYVETEDQLTVLAEVKEDMEALRPMDRLICGDVGYGKTEVALRAAFKAVMDGKQVAMLVPTTVLAQQHYHTFLERLSAFPIEVEMLSRFRTPHEQSQIIKRLSEGAVDIVIGTHRLLSSDVAFKDLGLLIIDEEQRFGVTHKETLKKMRTEIDVLTLTATPIPRTLYMALTGVRDISTINTPPEERLPIVTHVGAYSPRMVRQAILRELDRGGQVFFVHNRVQTIGAMKHHLERLVPEARITIAHGQMPENDLSMRMEQFTRGEVDVLLSTSIIESGLDIPNANTLIVDRADTFGLAQLYQLRGRVGRGAMRAYTYFFRHRRKPPTEEGRQRLETIAENTQLGAGFSIAMRDLEIRGAGDILGTRQHGHIAAVGFHLYTRLLGSSVRRLREKGELPLSSLPASLADQVPSTVNVDLPLPASIPSDYVSDKAMRLRLYRRLADVKSQGEITRILEEFNDRFGPPPGEVEHLLFQLKIKLLADRAGVSAVSSEAGQLVLRFADGEVPAPLPDLGPHARAGRTAIWIPYRPIPDWQSYLEQVLKVLQETTRQPVEA
jgi:transcription-repair coupling factor (superfamily II helicase)